MGVGDRVAALERLGSLHVRGLLSDAEFAAAKAELLPEVGEPGDSAHELAAEEEHSSQDENEAKLGGETVLLPQGNNVRGGRIRWRLVAAAIAVAVAITALAAGAFSDDVSDDEFISICAGTWPISERDCEVIVYASNNCPGDVRRDFRLLVQGSYGSGDLSLRDAILNATSMFCDEGESSATPTTSKPPVTTSTTQITSEPTTTAAPINSAGDENAAEDAVATTIPPTTTFAPTTTPPPPTTSAPSRTVIIALEASVDPGSLGTDSMPMDLRAMCKRGNNNGPLQLDETRTVTLSSAVPSASVSFSFGLAAEEQLYCAAWGNVALPMTPNSRVPLPVSKTLNGTQVAAGATTECYVSPLGAGFDLTGSNSDTANLPLQSETGCSVHWISEAGYSATIAYDGNGGSSLSYFPARTGYAPWEQSVGCCPFEVPTRDGFTFTGWNTAPDGSGTAYEHHTQIIVPAGTTTLFAQWEEALE